MPTVPPHVPPTAPQAVPNPLWVLRGTADRPLQCAVTQAPSALWFVTVSYGQETLLSESYPSLGTAMLRATTLKEGMMANGWRSAHSGPPVS